MFHVDAFEDWGELGVNSIENRCEELALTFTRLHKILVQNAGTARDRTVQVDRTALKEPYFKVGD